MQINLIKNTFIITFFIFSLFSFSFAQDTTPTQTTSNGLQYEMVSYTENSRDASTPLFNISFLNQATFTINYVSFSNAFQFFFDFIIGISIATAVVVFMIGAFTGIIAGDNAKSIADGRSKMVNAITGLMIILSTWLIINTINPDLVRLPIFQGLENLGSNTQSAPGAQTNVNAAAY